MTSPVDGAELEDDETYEDAIAALVALGLVVDSGKRNADGEILWTLAPATSHPKG
jgi:hypothetical protein